MYDASKGFVGQVNAAAGIPVAEQHQVSGDPSGSLRRATSVLFEVLADHNVNPEKAQVGNLLDLLGLLAQNLCPFGS
eukprot:1150527-Pelagomonas_calceolata.AAC.5